MRNFEFLAAACAFAFCFASYNESLHSSYDVQAFSFSESDTILKQTEHGGVEYLNKIIFLGDSRTYGLKSFGMLEGGQKTTQVWTPKNGTMSIWDMQYQKIVYPDTGIEMTCADAAALKQPKIILISLGFNGFDIVEKDYFIFEYTKLIESIKAASPDTKIILQSMFPVRHDYSLTANERIKIGNEWIFETAQKNYAKFLNTSEVLSDKDGFLLEEYTTDGCHLTPLGLDVQIEYVCTHMIGDS